jgi:hypothetical protein
MCFSKLTILGERNLEETMSLWDKIETKYKKCEKRLNFVRMHAFKFLNKPKLQYQRNTTMFLQPTYEFVLTNEIRICSYKRNTNLFLRKKNEFILNFDALRECRCS